MTELFNAGEKFSREFVITETVYQSFITMTGDRNPLHTEDKFAKEKGFSGRVMHGNILNGFVSFFIGECLPVKNVIIHTQTIQFRSPVYMHDQLQFDARISGIFESVNAIEFKYTFRKKNTNQLVAKGEFQIGII